MRLVRPLFQARTYSATLNLLLDLVVGVVWFSVLVTLVSAGLPLLITLVGIPILWLAFVAARLGGRFERWRVGVLLGVHVDAPRRHPARPGFLGALFEPFADPAAWKALGYLVFIQPIVGIVNFTLAVTFWSVGLGLLFLPTWSWALNAPPELWPGFTVHTPQMLALVSFVGLVVTIATPWVVRGLAWVDASLTKVFCGPGRRRELEARVAEVEESRARSVDVALADRRQIERDLHDGAQQRLLALGMDLGMALDRFDEDPESAKKLVAEAHGEAQEAIVELRNLARGIHPAVLTDRGLDAALSALAARSPVPVKVDVELAERPPASVEATAYFVVAEALTNVARYSGASSAAVRVSDGDGRVRVEVSDDGAGGAELRPGGGLAGLSDRAASLDGRLTLTSPSGGPTHVLVELPCAS